MHAPAPVDARLSAAWRRARSPRERMLLRAKVTGPWWSWRFAGFGERSVLQRPEWINGAKRIAIGADVTIHDGVWLSAEPETFARPEPALVIGDGCLLRSRVFISASERVELDRWVSIGGGTSIIDSDHTWNNGRPAVWANQSIVSPVFIGEGTWLGDGCRVLKGTRIGRYCVVASGAVVRDDVPDFAVAVGVPARVVGTVQDRMQPEMWDRLHREP